MTTDLKNRILQALKQLAINYANTEFPEMTKQYKEIKKKYHEVEQLINEVSKEATDD